MSNIKYRQYNKENRQWHYWGCIDGQWVNPLQQDNYQLPEYSQRFTGLTDRNNKEIYEGDYIRMEDGVICVVSWLDDGFVLMGDGYNGEPLYPQTRNGVWGEVVGNEYENPVTL